ncbi:hypothetical protein PM082_018826 [Marasmius tenuissimus]|nr:hypothetical protein PM082_018826 [Marasmius tenuissimus]
MEGDSDEAPPIVWEFNSKCLRRFPNSSNALTALRKLGKPPSSFDISHPSKDNLLALSALVALGMRVDRRHAAGSMVQNIQLLKRNWTATIDRWMRFLLDQVLLHDEGRGPSTPDGVDYFDISAGCANLLLSYPNHLPGSDVEMEFSELFSSSPYIPTSVARIWLRTVKARHYSYKMWSQHVNLGSNAKGFHHALQTIHSRRDEDVVSVCMNFIRQDMEKTQASRQLSLFHMADVLQVFAAMSVIHSPKGPFYDLFLNRGIIQLLHDYLRTLYKKAKHFQPLTDQFLAAQSLIELVLRRFLSPFIVGPIPILEAAIGSGCGLLIHRIFNFLSRDSDRAVGDKPARDPGMKLMAMISTHIIYPSILHEVLRHIPTISRLEREGKLQSKMFTPFLAEWKRIVKKAIYLKEVRRGAKERPLYLVCDNPQCERIGPAEHGVRAPRYLRCSQCLTAVYCSRICGILDWKHGHRQQCMSDYAKWNVTTHYDWQFFREILHHYCMDNRDAIFAIIKDLFFKRFSNLSGVAVVVDFHRTGSDVLSASPIAITEIEKLRQEGPRLEKIIEAVCEDADGKSILVLGIFPVGETTWEISYLMNTHQLLGLT